MTIWGVTPKSFSNLLSNLVPSLLLLKWELLFNSWVKTPDVRMEQSWAAGKPQSLYPQSMIYPCWFHGVFPYHTLKLPVGDFLNSRLINHCPIKSFIGDFLASHGDINILWGPSSVPRLSLWHLVTRWVCAWEKKAKEPKRPSDSAKFPSSSMVTCQGGNFSRDGSNWSRFLYLQHMFHSVLIDYALWSFTSLLSEHLHVS